jgi:hypothetical protein
MKRIPSLKLLFLTMLFLTISMLGGNVASQDMQEVFLNGERLTHEQAAILEQLVGVHIPSGRYWIDVTTGLWGYGDSPSEDLLDIPEQGTNDSSNKKYFEDTIGEFGFDIPPIQY